MNKTIEIGKKCNNLITDEKAIRNIILEVEKYCFLW